MPVTLEELRELQKDAVALAKELEIFGRSFERQFVLGSYEREIVNIYERHMGEILLGAMVGKEQFNAEFDGEQPGAGKFGMVTTRAAYFGIGDDWDAVGVITGGAPQPWIHSGTALLGGTADRPIMIGDNALHIIIAIGTLHPSPKIETIFFQIDGKPKPILNTWYQFIKADLRIKELDTAFIWRKGVTVLSRTFQKETAADIPFLMGASFLPEAQLRLHDPVDVVAPAQKVVLVT